MSQLVPLQNLIQFTVLSSVRATLTLTINLPTPLLFASVYTDVNKSVRFIHHV